MSFSETIFKSNLHQKNAERDEIQEKSVVACEKRHNYELKCNIRISLLNYVKDCWERVATWELYYHENLKGISIFTFYTLVGMSFNCYQNLKVFKTKRSA